MAGRKRCFLPADPLFPLQLHAQRDRARRRHGVELDELRSLHRVDVQHGPGAEDGVADAGTGREALRRGRIVQKTAGKADVFPCLTDEVLPRGLRIGLK